MYMCVWGYVPRMWLCPQRLKEGIRTSETDVTGGCELATHKDYSGSSWCALESAIHCRKPGTILGWVGLGEKY